MTILRAAVVQAETSATLGAGLAITAELSKAAAAKGARLIVFPETWLPGYPIWLDVCRDVALWDSATVKDVFARHAAESVDVAGDGGAALGRVAAEANAALVVGVVERVRHGLGHHTLYNALLTYGPDGRLLNHHRKLMPTYTERLLWGQGDADGLRTVDAGGAAVGGLVCWEHWMPLARQALHDAGEDIHVAAWPTVHEMHQLASRHYAFEGRCFVIAAGSLMRARALPPELEPHPDRVKSPDQYLLRGGSAILAPDGSYLVEPVFEREATLVADLDLSRVRRESITLDVAGHYSRPDCFDFAPRRGPRDPAR
jgi:predicted amidohydrolase